MGGTRNPTLGCFPLPGDVMPGRSPGTLGRNDAGDPDARMCMAADTPGTVGTGGDLAMSLLPQERFSCEMPIQVIEVDLGKMRRFLYTVAYAEAANAATTRGFASAEIDTGNQMQVEAAARSGADFLMAELQQALAAGPEAVKSFVAAQEARKARAQASLQTKFAEAQQAGNRWVSVFGWTVKGLSAIKFASTVTIKTLSIITGPGGTVVDFVYSGVQAGVKYLQTGKADETLAGVVVEETGKNIGQELGDFLNESLANGLMTQAEKNKIEGLIGNYQGNAKKIEEQLANLEKQIQQSLKTGNGAKKIPGLMRRNTDALAKLKNLRVKTANALLKSGKPLGLAKKAGGKTLSLVFLASEVKDAWNEAAAEWRASD